jgi:hypothetical protein
LTKRRLWLFRAITLLVVLVALEGMARVYRVFVPVPDPSEQSLKSAYEKRSYSPYAGREYPTQERAYTSPIWYTPR